MLVLESLKQCLLDESSKKLNDLVRVLTSHKYHLQTKGKEIGDIYKQVAQQKSREAYEAAYKYLAGDLNLAPHDYDLIAFALSEPITELSGLKVVSDGKKLNELLSRYSKEIDRGEFWELTCLGVLQSYFQISDVDNALDVLREFLSKKFKRIYDSCDFKPVWMEALNKNQQLLSKDPCAIYAIEWLNGNDDRVSQIKSDIKIPENSWFWKELVFSCVKETTKLNDFSFKESIPKLLAFLRQHPAEIDDGLKFTLERYRNCSDVIVNNELKDFAVEQWHSPRLRVAAGSKWRHIDDSTWKMVLGWVNEANLRLFFQILKQRGIADKDRLDFWLKYINQVSWTKLVLGGETDSYLKRNKGLADLYEKEKASFSRLLSKGDLDAFIMQIQNYLIVEFSTEGGCYIYKEGSNSFDPDADFLDPSTNKGGLRERRKTSRSPDIIHAPGWQSRATDKLMSLMILPDEEILPKKAIRAPTVAATTQDTTTIQFEDACRQASILAKKFGIKTEDLKYKKGNYWFYLDRDIGPLALQIKQLGFQYRPGKGWWI
ncbi:MAG: hypothetical protein A3F13_01945 [Gammaproteobacteria bacterium RIFCSPHIGHO2_12_FULL_40_19]|nr:MAG: hypothetical protein A3F13_01945 [Gammaproteobacteria bacterium RIFCSPHIGHO2_12_FULL_40_19]